MATIVIERVFHRPRSLDDLRLLMKSSEWCMALHGVVSLRHYLASDGRRLVCLFDAPDAEAVRNTIRTGGLRPPQHIWAATIHPALPNGGQPSGAEAASRSLAVVERCLAAPTPFDDFQAIEDAGRACFDQHDVKPLTSYFALDRRRMLCLYEAPDTESVRSANRRAGMPFDIAWHAAVIVEDRPSPRQESVPRLSADSFPS